MYLKEAAQKSHPGLRPMLVEISKLSPTQKEEIYEEALKEVEDDEIDRLIAGEHDDVEDFYCFKTSTTMGAIFSCLALPKPAMNRNEQLLHCDAAIKFLNELVNHSMTPPAAPEKHTKSDRLFCALPLKSLAEYANFCSRKNFYNKQLDDRMMSVLCPLLDKNNEMLATGRYPYKLLQDATALPIARHCVAIAQQHSITSSDTCYELIPKALLALSNFASVRQMLTRELPFLRRLEQQHLSNLSSATAHLIAGLRTRLERDLFPATMSFVSDED